MEFFGIDCDGLMIIRNEETGELTHLSYVDAMAFLTSCDRDDLTTDLAYINNSVSKFLLTLITGG